MKKNWIVLLGLFPMTLMAQGKKFTLSGNTTQAENCGVLFNYIGPDNQVKKDTGFVKNGHFTFSGTAFDERIMAQVIVFAQPRDYSLLFYLEPGNIQLDIMGDKVKDQRAGTPLNKELQEFVKMENAALDTLNANRKPTAALTIYHPDAQPTILHVIRKYMEKHPHSVIGIDQMVNVARVYKNPPALLAVYNLMDNAAQKSKQGIQVKTIIDGMPSPDSSGK
ncbi:DUF4369 domain-containing protein [Chitinophaga arvensicola]|uniref:DUF4369 domain-containing protein n=1 Tax=Chitinophaga arvensicola TaxID=29529 RepID=A0A1I0R3H5_9BACT|nr:DUF4369 domain-containing protein [Chitinophaga arvensicola]SEW35014.1 protein of unknown function [Chitinophaga arvensicola]